MDTLITSLIPFLPKVCAEIIAAILISVVAISFCFRLLKPIFEYIGLVLFKKYPKLLGVIIENNNSLKETCEAELDILQVQSLTKCRNRFLALFFIGVTRLTNNKISPRHFKKIYSYLNFDNDTITLSYKYIKIDNSVNIFFAVVFFLLASIFWYIFLFSSILREQLIIFSVSIALLMQGCYFLTFIVRKKDIDEFLKIKDAFLEKLLPQLKI